MSGWVAGAIVVGGVASAAIGAYGATQAADTQAQAAQNAQNISQNEFNTITGQEQPFMQAGYGAQGELGYLMGLPGYQNYGQGGPISGITQPGMRQGNTIGGGRGGFSTGGEPIPPGLSGFGGQINSGPGGLVGNNAINAMNGGVQARGMGSTQPAGQGGFGSLTTPFTTQNWQQLSPMYNFNVQQGRQGVLNADATGQGALSGAAAKDLINYNQSAANNSFGQAFNQYQTQQGNIFNRLSSIAQLGQNAAANTGMQGTALAGQAAQSATNIGTAQAGGTVGAANAISGGISNAMPWLYANSGTPNNNPANWDTENPNNFQDFASGGP